MEYVQFGRTGARVSPLCLGCMNFGGATEEKHSIEIIDRAIDEGINFLDTANVYNAGVSEEIVGKALADKGKRERVFLATKVHGKMGEGPNERGNSRRHIMEQVEKSLKRLGTDWIDLYQIHRPEDVTPIDETLRALDDLVTSGKVHYVGTSTFAAWQLVESYWESDARNIVRFDSEQPPYNILWREIENDVLKVTKKYDVAVIPWSPLAGGWLSGKYERGQDPPAGTRMARRGIDKNAPEVQETFDVLEALQKHVDAKGVSMSQFALAWALDNPAVTSPIIGPRTMDQLEDNLKALEVDITDEDRKVVDELVAPGTNVGR